MKIGVIGAGYVGLVASVGFADAGHHVVCAESDPDKLVSLQNGEAPFFEPGLQELLDRHPKRLKFVAETADVINTCPVIFLAIPTPERAGEQVDLDPTFKVMETLCQTASEYKVLVVKNTVPVGTARKLRAFIKEHAHTRIDVVSNPEFLRQGSALEDFLSPDRIVLGVDNEDVKKIMEEIYRPLLERKRIPVLYMDSTSAEMAKFAANSFLALKISFINELALLADLTGADIERVRDGFTSDHRIGADFFSPGIGYGGSCFSKDIQSLLMTGRDFDLDLKILQATEEVNQRQKNALAERLLKKFDRLENLNIGIWGLAFKPKTDDVRRAPALEIIRELFSQGARIRAFDPAAGENALKKSSVPFELVETAEQAAEQADALLILTEWPEFQAVDLAALKSQMKRPLILDGRNLFDPARMHALGYEYLAVGRRIQIENSTPT